MDRRPTRVFAITMLAALAIAALRGRHTAAFQYVYWLDVVAAHSATAPALFIGAYAVAVALLLPTLPLNLAAGALWGPALGSIVALAGSTSGALLAFLLARSAFGQPLSRRLDHGRARWLQTLLQQHGWKVVAFVRLNPVFPGPVNFLFGFTSISARTYCWATGVFLAPPTIAFAILGSSIGAAALREEVETLRRPLLYSGAAVLFLVVSVLVLRRRVFHQEPVSDDAR